MIFAAYCPGNRLGTVTPVQARKLTHLNIAFGVVKNGLVTLEHIREGLALIPALRSYNPRLNLILSLGGGDENQKYPFGVATRTAQGIEQLAESAMTAVRDFDLDGIDCDWEYPCNSGDPAEKQQHVDLMKSLRAKLDDYGRSHSKKCWLTYAAPCAETYLANVAVGELVQVADFINLMCYDFRWAGPLTGFHCNTFSPSDDADPTSVAWAIEKYGEAGAPPAHLVLGAAFYSHRYDGVTGNGNGYGQPYTGEYSYGPSYTDLYHNYEHNSRFAKYWHDEAKQPWLFDGHSFITYDDATAMVYKAELVRQKGLAGMMYWEHSADLTGILFNAIYDNLIL
ncbi:MAG TPA: chitinase [Clostridiales bacterium]|nr:chitinase [Clostridiales bacterium]